MTSSVLDTANNRITSHSFIPFITDNIGIRTTLFFIFASTRNIYKNTLVMGFSLIMGVILDKFTANDKNFRKVLVIGGLNRFAYGIGIMYLNVFLLIYLKIDYIYYSILNILVNFSEALFSRFWATKSQNRKCNNVLAPMSIIYILVFMLLFILDNNILLFSLLIIYILLGLGNSAYEMFDHIAIHEHSKEDYKTSYVTFERFIEEIVTATLPILSYLVFPENSNSIKITFLLAVITYLFLFIYIQVKNQYLKSNEK